MRFVSRRTIICLCITSFWLVMMVLLAKREYYASVQRELQEEEIGVATLSDKPRTSRLGIFFLNEKIGIAVIHFYPQKDGTAIVNTRVDLTAVEATINIQAKADIFLGKDGKLTSFGASFGAGNMSTILRGTVVGDNLDIVYSFGGKPGRQRIPFKNSAFFSSGLTPLIGGLRLAPGEKQPIALWNPLTRRVDRAWLENKGKTRLQWNGRVREVQQLQLVYGGMALSAWVTDDGDVLRQQAPFGLVLEKEEEAAPPRSKEKKGPRQGEK